MSGPPPVSMPIEPALLGTDILRIRELSKSGRHREALTATEALASAAPQNRDILYLIAANQRCLKLIHNALATLQLLERYHPRFSLLRQERGYCYTALRDAPRAVNSFLRAVEINPALLASWTMLERLCQMTGDASNGVTAARHVSTLRALAPDVVRAGSLFSDGDLSAAAQILRTYLLQASDDVEALRLLARIEQQNQALDPAESLLETAVARAPHNLTARSDQARVLLDRQKYLQAQEEIDMLLALEPNNADHRSLRAVACVGLGQYEPAIELYRQLLSASSESAELYLSLGHALQMLGKKKEATESYQTAARIKPDFGDAWWSLANLKS
jgi:tetratricopeptide (TPR) repeat protein